uniref:Si:dkey-117n7.5 n=1 Tax=Mastacembelus armatus TaxID=205130 RepID=A0A3Q3LPV3_9TELE
LKFVKIPLVFNLLHLFFFISDAVSGTDRCLEPMSEGVCSEYVLLWYFHPPSGECRPFVYGGCGGNRNRFPSRHECQSWCGMERRGENQIRSHMKHTS